MVFGLTQWLISFVIFLIVLTIITWSAVHLSKKDHNSTDIGLRFFDTDDHAIQREKYVKKKLSLPKESFIFRYLFNKSLSFMNVRSSTSRVIENTDGPTLFADDQGSEIPNSAEFYNFIMKTFLSKNSTTNRMGDNTATTIFTSSVIDNDTTWSKDAAITIFTPSISNDTMWSEDAAITIFTPFTVNNDTTWRKENTTIAIHNTSDKSFLLLNNHQNISEKL